MRSERATSAAETSRRETRSSPPLTRGALLPAWAAGLVLVAYTLVLVVIGGRRVVCADITQAG